MVKRPYARLLCRASAGCTLWGMLIDVFVSLALTAAVTIAIRLYAGEMNAFPVLTFLVVAVLSYIGTAFVHSLLVH